MAVSFAIGNDLNFMEMQKAFNPIIGETFQGLINGCPCYAEQISHRPPITNIFMKGRGYTVYGSKEPKVELSLNSACGSNEGYLNISFDDEDITKKVIRFSNGGGQISGLIYGPRVIIISGKSLFYDE